MTKALAHFVAFSWLLCSLVLGQSSATTTSAPCNPPARTGQLWTLEESYIVVGELHGNQESPALFAEMVCAAAEASSKPVLVALEFPTNLQQAFNEYLASDGSADAEEKFLQASGLRQMAANFPDGRSSQAMWDMVRRLRDINAVGANLKITTFQSMMTRKSDSQEPYEKELAGNLQSAFESGNYGKALVLVGNIHARKTVVSPGVGRGFAPMVMHLPANRVMSLVIASMAAGESWSCQQRGCNAGAIAASPIVGIAVGLTLSSSLLEGYDGVLGVSRYTASYPLLNPQPTHPVP